MLCRLFVLFLIFIIIYEVKAFTPYAQRLSRLKNHDRIPAENLFHVGLTLGLTIYKSNVINIMAIVMYTFLWTENFICIHPPYIMSLPLRQFLILTE
jgi:hypothetical protein